MFNVSPVLVEDELKKHRNWIKYPTKLGMELPPRSEWGYYEEGVRELFFLSRDCGILECQLQNYGDPNTYYGLVFGRLPPKVDGFLIKKSGVLYRSGIVICYLDYRDQKILDCRSFLKGDIDQSASKKTFFDSDSVNKRIERFYREYQQRGLLF